MNSVGQSRRGIGWHWLRLRAPLQEAWHRVTSDSSALILLYGVSLLATDRYGITILIGAAGIGTVLWPGGALPGRPLRRDMSGWLLMAGFAALAPAILVLLRCLPEPLGGQIFYYWSLPSGVHRESWCPGAVYMAMFLIPVAWLLLHRPAEPRVRSGPSVGRLMVLLVLLLLPVYTKKLFFVEQYMSQFAAVPTGALILRAANQLYVTALSEELYYRRFLFAEGSRWIGKKAAAVLSSTVFALAHLQVMQELVQQPSWGRLCYLGSLWLMGMVLCHLYQQTRSLPVLILYHAALNTASIGAVLAWRAGQTIIGS